MAKEVKKSGPKKSVEGRWNLYDVSGGLKRKNQSCPKCKSFLAKHSNRLVCGQCGYMEALKA